MTMMRKSGNPVRRLLGQILTLGALISALTLAPIRPAGAQEGARSWSFTGSLNTPRVGQSATLLPDGKVLVVGGYIDDGVSAELYDPSTGTWSPTGSPREARGGFTATLLPNGKVLVAGGNATPSPATTRAEVYDPTTGTWSLTGNLHTPRILHSATLLWNGKVLVVGGDDGKGGEDSSPLITAELYDPQTGVWSFTGNLNVALEEHTATLLQDGRVLVAGGYNHSHAISAQIYDPDAGSWSSVGSLSLNNRFNHTAILLPDGRVLIVGGIFILGNVVDTAELYDPMAGKLSSTGPLNFSRMGHTATLLPNGKVLIAGGSLFGSLISSELYDPSTGTWSFTDNLNTARTNHTTTLLYDGKVLIAGGRRSSAGNDSILDSVELGDNFALVATPAPNITGAAVGGGIGEMTLWVDGENFAPGAVILLNGKEQKTRNYAQFPNATLISEEAGRKIKPGDRLQARNPDGAPSEVFIYTSPST
jgi:N-acetylneuraminic acid mutarotase